MVSQADLDKLMIENTIINNQIKPTYNIDFNQETLTYDEIQFLVTNIPAVNSIMQGMVNYIFAGEMQLVKDDDSVIEGDKLKDILNSRNVQGSLVFNMFKQLTREMFEQGTVGIRKVSGYKGKGDSFMLLPKNSFDIMFVEDEDNPLVYKPLLYLIKESNQLNRRISFHKDIEEAIDSRFEVDDKGNIVSTDNKMLALTDDDFVNMTLDGSFIGISPFEYDKKRTHLILQLLDYYIHDFQRNGIGTLAFKYNETMLSRLTNGEPSTTGQIFDSSVTNARFNVERKDEDISKLTAELAKVEYNDSVIYSDLFSDMQQLTRDSKPSDYLDILSVHATRFVCQVFGVSPQVFDLDEGTGNIGKDEVIKTFILHTIIPWRTQIASKLTEIIHFIGYEGYTLQFKNDEIVNYHDYEKDSFIAEVYNKLVSAGDKELADKYIRHHLDFGDE